MKKKPMSIKSRDLEIKKYVAYIDVLGFAELVNNKNYSELITYFKTIKKVLKVINKTKLNIQSLLFSDCIILSAPSNEIDFQFLLQAIQTIQAELIIKGIIFRGAVSYGELYFDYKNNILVGKGLIKAWQLEKEAIYGRVIIDPAIIPLVSSDRKEFITRYSTRTQKNDTGRIFFPDENPFLKLPGDNTLFIDYLLKIYFMPNVENNVLKILDFLKSNIYHYKTQEKYLWLRKYFHICHYKLGHNKMERNKYLEIFECLNHL